MDLDKNKEMESIDNSIVHGDLNYAIHALISYARCSYEEAKEEVHRRARIYEVLKTAQQRYEGFCHNLPLKMGDKITIRKGTEVTRGNKKTVQGRNQTITVWMLMEGSNQYVGHHGEIIPPTNPAVVWAGSGGIWCECDLNNIDIEMDVVTQ